MRSISSGTFPSSRAERLPRSRRERVRAVLFAEIALLLIMAVLMRRMEMNQLALAARGSGDAPVQMVSRPTLVHRIRQLFGLNGRADAPHRS